MINAESRAKRVRTGVGFELAFTLVAAGAAFWQGAIVQAAGVSAVFSSRTMPTPLRAEAPPPSQLQARIEALGQSIDGKVGIAVQEITSD